MGCWFAWAQPCEIDGRLPGGLRFRVLGVGDGVRFEVLVTVRAHVCEMETRY